MTDGETYCERCGKILKPGEAVWLELNMLHGTWHKLGSVPVDESQGCFPFGKDCARKTLENNE